MYTRVIQKKKERKNFFFLRQALKVTFRSKNKYLKVCALNFIIKIVRITLFYFL